MNDQQQPIDPLQPPDQGAAHDGAVGPHALDAASLSETAKSTGSSTLVLVALLIISGAVLWGMRHLGTRGSINLVDIAIDYPTRDASATASTREVIQALNSSNSIPQIEPQMIAFNPFSWRASPQTAVETLTPEQQAAQRAEREHQQRMRQLELTATNLMLFSVMRGRIPVANISGELVRVGDTVAEHFVVTRIEGRSVDIEAEGITWTLTVGDDG